MKNSFKRSILIATVLLLPHLVWAQSGEIKIQFIGNCGLYMTDGQMNIYTDFPYKSGAYGYMQYDASELDSIKENSIFIFTHKHADHYSNKLLKQVLKAKGGKKFGPGSISKLEKKVNNIPNFSVEPIKTKHRFSFSHYSYIITWHGKKIFLSGDTESAATIAEIKDLDWAFVPYWILLDAHEKNIEIDAEKIGVYHLYPNQKLDFEISDKTKLFDQQGMGISISY